MAKYLNTLAQLAYWVITIIAFPRQILPVDWAVLWPHPQQGSWMPLYGVSQPKPETMVVYGAVVCVILSMSIDKMWDSIHPYGNCNGWPNYQSIWKQIMGPMLPISYLLMPLHHTSTILYECPHYWMGHGQINTKKMTIYATTVDPFATFSWIMGLESSFTIYDLKSNGNQNHEW